MGQDVNYPYKKEKDDFLYIMSMRGGIGYISLVAGIVLLAFFLMMSVIVLVKDDMPKLALIFSLFMTYVSVSLIRGAYKQISIGMYYYTHVSRDEIAWGDMFQKTVINISDVVKIDMGKITMRWVRLTLRNGKTHDIEERFLWEMDKLHEKLKSIDGIEVNFVDAQ